MRHAIILVALLLLGVTGPVQAGPAEPPVDPFVRLLHDCGDDYGVSANRYDQTGHDLVALDVAETQRPPSPGATGVPMIVFRVTESRHSVNPAANSDEFDNYRRDLLQFRVDGDIGRTFTLIMQTENGVDWESVGTTSWDFINTGLAVASDSEATPRQAHEIGFRYSTLGLRNGERITDVHMQSFEPRQGEFVQADYMPGGYMDHLRQEYRGGNHDPFRCDGAPPEGDPAYFERATGLLVQASNVVNQPPQVVFTYLPLDPRTGTAIRFSDLSTDPDGDRITSWLWRFDDGTVASDNHRPLHTYDEKGTYDVELVVQDHLGATASATVPVVVLNSLPIITLAEANPRSPIAGERVQFRVAVHETDGTIAAYQWNFGDGSNLSADAEPAHVFETAGVFSVALTVEDNDGGQSSTVFTVQVRGSRSDPVNDPPAASFVVSKDRALPGETLTFTDTSTDDDRITDWAWDFGDGITATTRNTAHHYAVAGVYVVNLTVTDSIGHTHTATRSITVNSPPAQDDGDADDDAEVQVLAPTARFTYAPDQVFVGEVVEFTDQSKAQQGTIDLWRWTFGDGGKSSFRDATHTYREPGVYRVTLTVGDSEGSFASHVINLDVVSTAGPSPGGEIPGAGVAATALLLAALGIAVRRRK